MGYSHSLNAYISHFHSSIQKSLLHPWSKAWVIILCTIPGVGLVYGAFAESLGPNPAETLIRQSGDITIRALCYVLALTPLRELLKLPALGRMRRILGLSVFFYALMHLLCYAWLDMGLLLEDILADTIKRPFIFVGVASFIILLCLAITSFNAAIKTLGGKLWRRLHSGVYLVAILATLHFYWMRASKHRLDDVIFYGTILFLLLLYRIVRYIQKRNKS